MKARQQYWLHVMVLGAGGIAYSTLAIYWSPVWLVGSFVVLIAVVRALMHLTCELCGDPLLYREHQLFGRDIEAWWPTLPDHCQTCDHPVADERDLPDNLEPALQGLS
jgi:hypothetical protein